MARPVAADPAWALSGATVADRLQTSLTDGLTDDEALARRERWGSNELDAAPPVPPWRRALAQFQDPLVLLLLFAILVSLGAWASDGREGAPLESVVIIAIVVLNAVIGYWQETRAIEAVAALQQMTATHATVVRGGRTLSIPSASIVPGDLLVLSEGDAVGADARLSEAASLQVAEAALTGESAAVDKSVDPVPRSTDLVERVNMVFHGTAVAHGRGRAVVTAIGMSTEIGRIASLLDTTTQERTPLQRQIDWLGKVLGVTVVVLSAIVVLAILLTSEVTSAADVFEALLVGVSLAVAAVPEGLPAILTVVLALGVQRMAGHNAVVKKLLSVETLGAASVICTDKTGTLTRNEMTIVRVATPSGSAHISGVGYHSDGSIDVDAGTRNSATAVEEIHELFRAGLLVNDASMSRDDTGTVTYVGDPTEIAFVVAGRKLEIAPPGAGRLERVGEVPFDSRRKLMSTVHRDDDAATGYRVVTKGAPDVLIERCTHERVAGSIVPLTSARRSQIAASVDAFADDALRTLAVAERTMPSIDGGIDESIEQDLVHLGVVGIVDPPRDEAARAIREAHAAGVRVIMITGDHPRTATRVGTQLGLVASGRRPLTAGPALADLSPERVVEAVRTHSVFARVAPDDKLRIVDVLQQDGEIVAMTGDGVNDAPALKQADIGVAMGINGTEVSKEAADMILVDDDFTTILHAIREGREIFSDIQKFLRYLLASNTGEVLVMFFGVLFAGALGLSDAVDGLAVPLLATQILWINLLTDSALALALGVDPAVDDVMARRPRRISDRVIDRSMMVTIVLVGSVTALAGLIAFDLELAGGLLGGSGDIETARTMVFTTVVLAQIFNAFNSRSDVVSAFVDPFSNRLLWLAAVVTVLLQVAVVHLPPLNRAFDTVPLDATRWATCAGLASLVLVADELRKAIGRWSVGRATSAGEGGLGGGGTLAPGRRDP